jgi:uncharacterized membrane protein YphA (DoxX/SURF4 family)
MGDMAQGIAATSGTAWPREDARGWKTTLNWVAAILIALVFLVSGIWKLTDPIGAAARLAQAKVPEGLSIPAAMGLGTVETFAGILLLIPSFRRWGAALGTFLLAAFMLFVGYHYQELRGAECTCFPWIKRAVGPAFFAGDGIMMLLAIAAGIGVRRSRGVRPAAFVLTGLAVLSVAFYGYGATRHNGTPAPASITAENGQVVSLKEGKVLIFFFDPQCLHCLAAGRKFASFNWGTTRVIGVPTQNPQFGDWFLGKAGLTGKATISKDLELLKKTFPFDSAPAAVAIQDGYEKAMLLQFETDTEPLATLKKIGFVQ